MRAIANYLVERAVRAVAATSALFGAAAIAATAGCSSGGPVDPTEVGTTAATELVATTEAALNDTNGGTAYDNDCKGKSVPLPPNWGAPNIIGSGGKGSKAWTSTGSFPESDSFFGDIGAGNIWYVTSSSPAGICVINAHDTGSGSGEFDVICQGTNGKACFWAGNQSSSPPSGSVAVLENSWTSGGAQVTHDTAATNANPDSCPSCHAGENVFLTHFTPGHPTNLTGKTGWMPTSWYDPMVSTGFAQNQGPDPFAAYYPQSTSTPTCTSSSCHAKGGLGGRFPQLSRNELAAGYCTILAEVTNRPGSAGGMPPGNTCTPDFNCARQTDPFVLAMLDTCNGTAVSRSNSPAANDAYGSTTPYSGFYDHAVVDNWSNGTHQVLLMDDAFNDGTNKFGGWKATDYTVNLADTYFRTTTWLKGSGTEGSDFTIAATDDSGTIFESVGPNNRRDVTINAAVLAAGSPSAYVRHDGHNVIVYRGVDSYIYESYWDGVSQWNTNKLPGQMFTAMGDPIGYNRGSSSSVIYKCQDEAICEERLVNGTWYWRSIETSAAILPFVPVPIVSQYNGYEHTIFYAGIDGVHAVVDPCEPWYSCNVTDGPPIYASTSVSSAAVPYNSQNGGTAVVFITDPGGLSNPSAVVQVEALLNGGWTATTLYSAQKSSETLVGDPAGYLSQGPYLNTVLFRNTAGKLYQMQWSNSQNKYVKSTVTL